MQMMPQENNEQVHDVSTTRQRHPAVDRSKVPVIFFGLMSISFYVLAFILVNIVCFTVATILLSIAYGILKSGKDDHTPGGIVVESERIPEWKNLDVPKINSITIIQPPVSKKRVYEEENHPTYWDIANSILSQYHIRIITDGGTYSTLHFMQAIFSPHDEDCLEVTSLTAKTKVSLLDKYKGVAPRKVTTTYVWYLTKCVATILEESEISRKELTVYHPDVQFTKQQLNHELQKGTGK